MITTCMFDVEDEVVEEGADGYGDCRWLKLKECEHDRKATTDANEWELVRLLLPFVPVATLVLDQWTAPL